MSHKPIPDQDDHDNDNDDHVDDHHQLDHLPSDGNPLVVLVFDFFVDPHTSKVGIVYGYFLSILVAIHFMVVGLETCDGPNQYPNDYKRATYHFLPTKDGYWMINTILLVPIVVDAIGRGLLLIVLYTMQENKQLRVKLMQSKFSAILFIFDFVSVLPYMYQALYLRPYKVTYSGDAYLLLQIVDLMMVSRILRITKDTPALWAIRIALVRASEHLVLPFFVFLVFNITAAVIFFFAEPCYNSDTCPWHNLFEAMFFSVVTMTSVGYGNQIPQFALCRMVALCVMVFGAVFMSMPLAIIGNEYGNAWLEVTKSLQKERKSMLEKESEKSKFLFRKTMKQISSTTAIDSMKNVRVSMMKSFRNTSLVKSTSFIAKRAVPVGMLRGRGQSEDEGASSADDNRSSRRQSGSSSDSSSDSDDDNDTANIRPVEPAIKNALASVAHAASNAVGLSAAAAIAAVLGGRGEQSNETQEIETKARIQKLQTILSRSAIVEMHHKIIALLESLSRECTGASRMSPTILMGVCELRSLMSGLVISSRASIEHLTKGIDEAETTNKRRASAISTIRDSVSNIFGGLVAPGEGLRMRGQAVRPNQLPAPANIPRHGKFASLGALGTAMLPTIPQRKLGSVAPIGLPAIEQLQASGPTHSEPGWLENIVQMVFGSAEDANEDEFTVMMQRYARDPNNLRNRLWLLLDSRNKSKGAMIMQRIILVLIMLSVLLLFTETIPSWGSFGEDSVYCESVVQAYCVDKFDPILDPGCFAQNNITNNLYSYVQRSAKINQETADYLYKPARLRFDCEGYDCFGVGLNYGSPWQGALSCQQWTSPQYNWTGPPFQVASSLLEHYGSPTLFTSRPKMHRLSDVCLRMECNPKNKQAVPGNKFWIKAEIVITVIFTIELLLRMSVAESVVRYLFDIMNIFDILSILPFYIDVFANTNSKTYLDFSIIPSSPQTYLLVISRSFKVFRMFKIIRQFDATKVLVETIKKTHLQLLGILALLTFLVVLFAILLFEMEKGKVCFEGDIGCPDIGGIRPGARFMVNKLGSVSQFPDVFYGLWFCFVTLTTTGYGEMVPVTNTGQIMTVILMLAGSCYLSMPLAVAASTFYEVHQTYNKQRRIDFANNSKAIAIANDISHKAQKDRLWRRRLAQIKTSFEKYLEQLQKLLQDMQSPVTEINHPGGDDIPESKLMTRVKDIVRALETTMSASKEDIEDMVLTMTVDPSSQLTDDIPTDLG